MILIEGIGNTYRQCPWDPKYKVPWCPFTEHQFNGILRFLKGKAWLGYSRFQTVKPSPSYPELPPPREVITWEINTFVDWMRNKRYSESTIKTHKETMLRLIYACGLRRCELLNPKIQDVDSGRGLLMG